MTKQLYMQLAKMAACLSTDTTKVGCIIVKDGVVLSSACNKMAEGVIDIPYRRRRPDKYKYVEHAERNCLYDCCRRGVKTEGAEAHMTLFCCVDGARGLIQAGVVKVVCPEPDWADERWGEDWGVARMMLIEAGVTLVFVEA